MNYTRKPAKQDRKSVGLDAYAYNKQNTFAPEQPTVIRLTENERNMGVICHFAGPGKTLWLDTQDLLAKAGDLADQIVDSHNNLIFNVKVGFDRGSVIVLPA